MITPAWHIRNATLADMPLIRQLFEEQGMGTVEVPKGIRVAITPDNIMLGALRCEELSDGAWYVRPVVVFDSVRGTGVGRALMKDALKLHPDLRLVAEGYCAGFYDACGMRRCSWDEMAYEQRHECDVCPGRQTCGAQPFRSVPPKHTLTFLGTTSGCGVPAFFCHCKACEAARKDPSLRRGCSGVLIQGNSTILVDTPPDVRHQLIREDVSDLDHVFLTHAHYDHLGGFGELEYLVRLYRESALPFHASVYAMGEALREFHYMDDCFDCDPMEEWEVREVDGLSIQAVPVEHCPGCFGYLITSPSGKRTFYAPDTAALKPEVRELLAGVDNLIMDATFLAEGASHSQNHHSVRQTVEEGMELGAGTIYLTHFAPHICRPEENAEELLEEYVAQFGGRVVIARDGMKVEL